MIDMTIHQGRIGTDKAHYVCLIMFVPHVLRGLLCDGLQEFLGIFPAFLRLHSISEMMVKDANDAPLLFEDQSRIPLQRHDILQTAENNGLM
jgi:hypothetical protein